MDVSNGFEVHRHQENDPKGGEFIRSLSESQGLQSHRWSNQAGDYYPAHSHTFQKIIWVIRGEITFILPEYSKEVILGEGDRLELAANIVHEARVGKMGVTCLEFHL